MDRLGSISVFLSVAEHGSFARAGSNIGVSGSAVSKSVSRLEDRLRVRLFNRTTRSLSLTDEGLEFRTSCSHIISELEQAEKQMLQRASAPSGTLRVSAPATFGRIQIVPALKLLAARFPDLKVEASFSDGIVDMVDAGFDLTVRIGEPRDSGLIMRRVGTVRYIVCAAPSYFDCHSKPLSIADLSQHDCVKRMPFSCSPKGAWKFYDPETTGIFEHEVSSNLSFDSADAVLNAALAGSGLAQLNHYTAEPYLRSGELVQVLSEISVDGPPVLVLYPSTRHLTPKVRAFIDIITHQLAERPKLVSAIAA
jgi:LysR family transcriptional regulator, regulator for bpeEF and oprC